MIQITVHYAAVLREAVGCSFEVIETEHSVLAHIFDEIKARHNLGIKANQIVFAINNEFCPPQTNVKPNDEILLMPPASGG